MTTQTASLYLLDDLGDTGRTSDVAQGDLEALRAVADWINTFVAKPHNRYGELGAWTLAEELRRMPWRAKRD